MHRLYSPGNANWYKLWSSLYPMPNTGGIRINNYLFKKITGVVEIIISCVFGMYYLEIAKFKKIQKTKNHKDFFVITIFAKLPTVIHVDQFVKNWTKNLIGQKLDQKYEWSKTGPMSQQT